MTDLKIVVPRRRLFFIIGCIVLLFFRFFVYAEDTHGILEHYRMLFAAASIATFLTIWGVLNIGICHPDTTRGKVIRSMIVPIIIIIGLFMVQAYVARGSRLFTVTDFALYLMTVGLLLTVNVMDLFWRLKQRATLIRHEQ